MTRAGRTTRRHALATLFADTPLEAVLQVLREATSSLTAIEVKAALQAGGVPRADADRRWPAVQRKLASHPQVAVQEHRYRWAEKPPVTPIEALDLLTTGRVPAARKAELLDLVRSALTADAGGSPESAARQRQAQIDAVRALAELAGEVEELTANEARAQVIVQRVRARVKRSGLEPIDQAGEETTFDRKRHHPITGPIRDGASVFVVRPGFIWKTPTEEVLIAKAVVEE
ncbi:MAG TPA: hypothetical protein VF163_19490 [Micromonosporaceae bacterium]